MPCSPFGLANGTRVDANYQSAQLTSENPGSISVRTGVDFQGHSTTEVTTQSQLGAATVVVKMYGVADLGTGVLTVYGLDATSASTFAGQTTSQQSTIVYTPPITSRHFTLQPGETEAQRTVTEVATVVTTVNGVASPPEAVTKTDIIDGVTFNGFETITVPAGTFASCKFTYSRTENGSTTTRTDWLLRNYGATIRDGAGGYARTLQINGVTVTHD